MRREVRIIVHIDPTEYKGVEDSAKGAIEVVRACLQNKADWAVTATIECEGEARLEPLV